MKKIISICLFVSTTFATPMTCNNIEKTINMKISDMQKQVEKQQHSKVVETAKVSMKLFQIHYRECCQTQECLDNDLTAIQQLASIVVNAE